MPTVENYQLIYSEKESKPGACPVCGGELDYGTLEILDTCVKYPWDCKSCGAEGYEYANLVFDGHRVDTATLPPARKRVYKDADGNLYFVRGGMSCTTFKGFRRLANPQKGQRRERGLHKLSYTPDKDQAQRDLDAYAVQYGLTEVDEREI